MSSNDEICTNGEVRGNDETSSKGDDGDFASPSKVDWKTRFAQYYEPDESINKKLVAFYDDNAQIYDQGMQSYNYAGASMGAELLHKFLDGRLDARILDVGGGTGTIIAELRKYAEYNNADGLDPSGKMLKIGVERGLYRKIYEQYFNIGSGIEHNLYDAICCSGVFMPGMLKAETVHEMCNLIKPGGYIVIVMRNEYLVNDEELQKLEPVINQMAEDKKIEVILNGQFPCYFDKLPGRRFVLQKC